MGPELTIVIPAKNEVAILPKLLESLCRQDYEGMPATRVLVADAGSADGTVEVALGFRDRLKVEVVAGGGAWGGRECGGGAGRVEGWVCLGWGVAVAAARVSRWGWRGVRC